MKSKRSSLIHEIGFVVMMLALLTFSSIEIKAQNGSKGKADNSTFAGYRSKDKAEYEVLKVACSKDGNCGVIIYCDPSSFNEKDMTRIGERLSQQFREKIVVNANLFDSRDIARSYANGTRSLGDLQVERRGWYLRTADREFLLFTPDPAKSNEQISIKLK